MRNGQGPAGSGGAGVGPGGPQQHNGTQHRSTDHSTRTTVKVVGRVTRPHDAPWVTLGEALAEALERLVRGE